MKSLSLILFVIGIPWALIAWAAVFGGPLGAIEALSVARRIPAMRFEAIAKIPGLLLISAQAIAGYMICARWLLIASGKRKASRRFWALAALHHLAWMFFAGLFTSRNPILAILYYSAAVFCACCVAAIASGRGKRPGNLQDVVTTPLGV